jgi:hypothetical protein
MTTLCAICLAMAFTPNIEGQEKQDPLEVKFGYEVGNTMPGHVVDFLAGAKDHGCGCPPVMISNARTKGIEIWSAKSNELAYKLAGALEPQLVGDKKPRAFLLQFTDSDKEKSRRMAKEHGLRGFLVAEPRTSTKRKFKKADGDNESEIIVFLLDRKAVMATHSFKRGELTGEAFQELVAEANGFLQKNSEENQ